MRFVVFMLSLKRIGFKMTSAAAETLLFFLLVKTRCLLKVNKAISASLILRDALIVRFKKRFTKCDLFRPF